MISIGQRTRLCTPALVELKPIEKVRREALNYILYRQEPHNFDAPSTNNASILQFKIQWEPDLTTLKGLGNFGC